MKILVDADACPVVDLTVREANKRQIPIILITAPMPKSLQ